MLFTVISKEAKQLLSDKGFLLIALIQPITFIVMFGSSFQEGDIGHLNTVVIDEDHTNFSHYVLDAANRSERFDLVPASDSLEKDMERLNKSEIRTIIIIPKGFEESLSNGTTAEIKVYADTSNFLAYVAINFGKMEIVSGPLKNITYDLLIEVEEKKEEGKDKIDEIKAIFNEIEKENELLQTDIDKLKNETNSIDTSELEELNKEIKLYLNNQTTSINQTLNSFDLLINQLTTLKAFNQTEEQKKVLLILQLSVMRNSFNSSLSGISNLTNSIDNIDFSDITDSNLSDKIEERTKKIKSLFEEADSISKEINLDFEMLKQKFLSEPLIINENKLFGPIRYFDYLGAGVLSLIIFFIGLMAPALNIVSEKEKNTLYRISTTPASSLTIFLGKFILFILFGFLEMMYTLFLAIFLYDLRITGSIYATIVILFLLSCAAISIGLFISSRIKSMQQALVMIPLIIIPSFLISNSFFPPEVMPDFMLYVSKITPMTFSNHALNSIMIKGFSLHEILPDIYVLIAFTLIPLILFIWSYRRMKY